MRRATPEKLEAATVSASSFISSTNPTTDTTTIKKNDLVDPSFCCECISVELVSLLLTGRVHSTLQGWATQPLGIGLLSSMTVALDKKKTNTTTTTNNEMVLVGKGLSRPKKPIWILRGPTCYSAMWLEGTRDFGTHENGTTSLSVPPSWNPSTAPACQADSSFAKMDRPGAVAQLVHFNASYGQRHKTSLRIVQQQETLWQEKKQAPLAKIKDEDDVKEKQSDKENKSLMLLRERRRANLMASQQAQVIETVDPSQVVTQEEMDRVIPNPQDQTFYPDKFTLWRYDFLEPPKTNKEDDNDLKVRAQYWKPFHILSQRERLLVETKLGPKIKPILLTRWPRATIDKFEPENPTPIV
jgi:hypothetical protein